MKIKYLPDYKRVLYPAFLVLMMIVAMGSEAIAQDNIVKGKVTDATDGSELPGVNVLVNGTSKGTVTDINGNFSISAGKGETLRFSFIGMKPVDVAVTGSVVDVQLNPDYTELEEVVVVGYGSQKKIEVTGAVAQLKSEDITRFVTSDVGAALQGQIAGVNVVSSGSPGASAEIQIRGVSSIAGASTPLYVVDGVPQEGDPRLSPNEIQTIDVLKDAASAAIYGTRGSSGVILITTKQGTKGTMRVSLDGSYGVQDITSGTPLMNAQEQTYFDIVKQRNISGTPDNQIVLELAKSPENFQNDTDLGELVFIDKAAVQNYSANISGGSGDVAYNVTLGYYNKEGVVVNSDFERLNTRINTTYKNGKWKLFSSVGMSLEETSYSPGGIITQTIKYYPTQDNLDLDSDEPISTLGGAQSNRLGWVLASFNNEDHMERNRVFGNFNADYEIVKGLTVSSRLGITASNDYRKRFVPYQEVYDRISGDLISDPSNSSVEMLTANQSSMSWDVRAHYNKTFNKKHNLSLTAVYSVEDYQNEFYNAKKLGVLDNSIKVLSGAAESPSANSDNNYVRRLIGMMGRVQYNYKSKYMISASVRRDGSSQFSSENRWGVFPSVSAGWNVAEEGFWTPLVNTVNGFKLRASYGTVGNERFDPYSYSASITRSVDYAFNSGSGETLANGSTQTSYANALVKWEISKQANFGADFGFFGNRLTLSADYYNTSKEDMLFPIVLPGSAGGGANSSVVLNVGNMTNQGMEFALGYQGITAGVKWGINGTFATNQNEITKINGEGGFVFTNDFGLISGAKDQSQVTVLSEGYEAGAFFIFETNGIADTNEKLAAYQQINPNARMGDLIYVDSDGDGAISQSDRVYKGSGLPEYEIGANFNAGFKQFDFSMQWYAALGHEVMNGAKATAYAYGRHKDLVSAWSEANPVTSIPAYRGDLKQHDNYKGYTDLWLEDGSYIRLKTITLGYSLPAGVLEKVGVSKFRVYASAQNLFTFTKYTGYDPEIGGGIQSRGLDKGNYPMTALYLLGVNLNF
ncbi:TonB-dependent receptor [Reichenbachiella carrageenanivorans]|uniref:TonB-dependent receptor n=1 Tax=Reichenbachiella carrageenanivorans TaxID=2979869 RepID=A0ABY6D4M6_9BACT|nr:TonB-dependent receptor [Reichenbachiella carrageenanivorans]UXX81097.1 TonB-dependent receptor [Reichenbachiella carrageenanivorans]